MNSTYEQSFRSHHIFHHLSSPFQESFRPCIFCGWRFVGSDVPLMQTTFSPGSSDVLLLRILFPPWTILCCPLIPESIKSWRPPGQQLLWWLNGWYKMLLCPLANGDHCVPPQGASGNTEASRPRRCNSQTSHTISEWTLFLTLRFEGQAHPLKRP